MNSKEIQEELKKLNLYNGNIDGQIGKQTLKAIDVALKNIKNSIKWTDARKLIAFEQLVYKNLNIEIGEIDGLVGEQTRYARDVYLDKKSGNKTTETLKENLDSTPPKTHKITKWPLQKDVTAFYGKVGENQVKLIMPFPMRLAWDPQKTIKSYSCHEKVHDAMLQVWNNVFDYYGYEKIKELRLDLFGGCLNVRKMRGGSSYSMHSWGIAIDIDPDRNQLKWGRDKATLDDPEYKKYWEFVYDTGAIGLGPERDMDWQHFQYCRLG